MLAKKEKKQMDKFLKNLSDIDKEILSVTAEILGKNGFAKTDMETVAKKVGVGKGTIYRHFGNKQQIVEKSIEWIITPVKQKVLSIILSEQFSIDTIESIMFFYIDYIWSKRFFFRSLIESVANEMSGIDRKRIQTKHIERFKIFLPIILKLKEDGIVKSSLSADYLSFILVGMMDTTVMHWIDSKKKIFDEEEFNEFIKIVRILLTKEVK